MKDFYLGKDTCQALFAAERFSNVKPYKEKFGLLVDISNNNIVVTVFGYKKDQYKPSG